MIEKNCIKVCTVCLEKVRNLVGEGVVQAIAKLWFRFPDRVVFFALSKTLDFSEQSTSMRSPTTDWRAGHGKCYDAGNFCALWKPCNRLYESENSRQLCPSADDNVDDYDDEEDVEMTGRRRRI